jgi:DNA processing protein
VPSDFVPVRKARECAEFVKEKFRSAEITRFGVRVYGAGDYPEKLRDAAHPIELLY